MSKIAWSLVLAMAVSVIAAARAVEPPTAACPVSKASVELGRVPWLRDYDAAVTQAKKSSRPLLILFQEVPGCSTCQNFGKGPLSHPLVLDAAGLFVPVGVHNSVRNENSADAKLLKRFGEPAWNNPVVRFVDADGKDLVPKLDRDWSLEALLRGMLAALEVTKVDLPPWLKLVKQEYCRGGSEKAVFAMDCYWSGEKAFGEIEGVIATRIGMCEGREVVEVDFDPTVIAYSALAESGKTLKCANVVIARNKPQFDDAAKVFPGKATVLSDKPINTKTQQKYQLFHKPIYFYLPLTELQATRANAVLASGKNPDELLSPSQLDLKKRLEKLALVVGQGAQSRFAPLKPDRSAVGLAAYAAQLEEFLAAAEKGEQPVSRP